MRVPVSSRLASAGLPSGAARFGLRAACGDGCAGRPLVGDQVAGSSPRRCSVGGGCQDVLQRGVAVRVIDVAVLPEAPDDAAPGAAGDADRVLVSLAARAGAG